MFAVDTNVFVHAADRRSTEHRACKRVLDAWLAQNMVWYSTWGVLYEFLRVVTHPKVFRHPLPSDQAIAFVRGLLACPSFEILAHTERHDAVLAETAARVPGLRGNAFHDAHTAVLLREHGIHRIVTRDAGFRRFPFLEVVDPLTLAPSS